MQDAAPSPSLRSDKWLAIGVMALCCVGLSLHVASYWFTSDDAYITFRYSWNFAHHNQMVFNLGEPVEGYTNFLWALLLGLLLKVGLRPDVMASVLGTASGCWVLFTLVRMTRLYRGGRPTPWRFVGPALLVTMPSFAIWCTSGLETQMFTALMLHAMFCYLREHRDRDRRMWSGFFFALAAMTRPEGMLVFGLTGIHRLATNLLGERRILPRRREIVWVVLFLVPFGTFMAWRMWYYGYPLPNTAYVKAGGSGWKMLTRWGLPYLWDFVHQNRVYVLAAFLPMFWPRTLREPQGDAVAGLRPLFMWSYLLPIVLIYAAYVCWVGGDFMAMGRFFSPLTPIIALLLQEALRETLERPRRDRAIDGFRWTRVAIVPLILVIAGGVNARLIHKSQQSMRYHRWGLDTLAYLKKFADDRILIGTWMRKNLPKDTYISVGGAGASIYASRFKALDAFGLNDEWIAHNAPHHGNRPGHSRFAPLSYALKKKPDLMCHIGKHQNHPHRPNASEARMWRSRGYEWACFAPPGLKPRYYCCLQRIQR